MPPRIPLNIPYLHQNAPRSDSPPPGDTPQAEPSAAGSFWDCYKALPAEPVREVPAWMNFSMDDYPDLIVEPAEPRILTIDDLRPANAPPAVAAMPRELTSADIAWDIWLAGGDASKWSEDPRPRREVLSVEEEIDLALAVSGFFKAPPADLRTITFPAIDANGLRESTAVDEPAAAPPGPYSAPAGDGAQSMDTASASEVIAVGCTWHADGGHPASGGSYPFE